jgi:hypothetical protein
MQEIDNNNAMKNPKKHETNGAECARNFKKSRNRNIETIWSSITWVQHLPCKDVGFAVTDMDTLVSNL